MRRKYSQDIFRNIEDYNNIVKGGPLGHAPLTINFYDDIYPILLRNMLDYHHNVGYCITQYISSPNDHYTKQQHLYNIYTMVLSVLEPVLTSDQFNYYEQEECDIEKYAKESIVCKYLSSYLDILTNPDQKRLFKHLIRFFYRHQGHTLQMRSVIPAEWADDLTNELHQCFLMFFRDDYSNSKLEKEILKYRFIPHPKAVKALHPLPINVKIVPTQYGCSAIVLSDVLFGKEKNVFLSTILKTQISETLLTGAIFENCMFLNTFAWVSGCSKTRFLFKSCIFNEEDIDITYTLFTHSLAFENCTFNVSINFCKFIFITTIIISEFRPIVKYIITNYI